jgi:hypothetical protein
MANWYQRRPSDDAKLIMLLRLGKVDLAIASLELCKHHCERETDDIPPGVEKHMRELRALDMVPAVDDMLQALKTKRRNRGGVAPRGTTEHHVEPEKRREEKTGEERLPPPSGEGSLLQETDEYRLFAGIAERVMK